LVTALWPNKKELFITATCKYAFISFKVTGTSSSCNRY
jgi:hypothetical protein